MKKTAKQMGALLLAAWMVLLAACAGEMDARVAFEDLLAKDYEVYYIFYSRGLPVDSSPGAEVEVDGGRYQPSTSEEYKTLADLRQLLESTYAGQAAVEEHLARTDEEGNRLFVEVDGKLCQSAGGDLWMLRFQAREDTLTLVEETGERAIFTLEEDSLDGSLYECTLSMVRTEEGWRLETPRKDGTRTLLREGSDQDTLATAGTAREVAESFLEALRQGDSAEIERLTMAPQGTYSGWSAIQTEAELAQVLEEGDSYGRYQVSLRVANGAGILPDGEQSYTMTVDFYEYTDAIAVRSFRPEPTPYSQLPYGRRDDGACEAVMEMINFFGIQPFDTPAGLAKETVAEYCLIKLLGGDKTFEELMEGISPQELADAADKYFGLADFQARDTAFYDAARDAYMAGGRGGMSVNYLVMGSREGSGGTVTVEARTYTDPLQTQNQRIYLYTLAPDGEGAYRFLSARSQ